MDEFKAGPRRILFLRQGSFSHINDRVAGWLRREFNLPVDEVDVLQEIIKPTRCIVLLNALATLALYGRRLACGEESFRNLFYRTPFLCQSLRGLLARQYAGRSHEYLFSIQTQSLYDGRIPGIPHFVYTDHTHLANLNYPGADPTRLVSPRWIRLETELYHGTRQNLVMSAAIRDSLLEQYGCDPTQVAVVGAAPNLEAPPEPVRPAGEGSRTILFVGVDWARKGGPLLVEAFKKVRVALPDARLIIAGCRPEVSLPGVEIVGRVPLAEIGALLTRVALLALPSLKEPQGVNCIEAMLYGVPVVASNIGALPEMVRDGLTGRILPTGDAKTLAETLIELLANPDQCRALGEMARKVAMENFTPQVVGQRFGQAIRRALDLPEIVPPASPRVQ